MTLLTVVTVNSFKTHEGEGNQKKIKEKRK